MTTPELTIVYLTNRRQPRSEWFFRSLPRQLATSSLRGKVQVVFIDHWAPWAKESPGPVITSPPKPNVWNGPHRLTKDEWFAAGSARNTGVCLAKAPWIAFVDDLSVLMPGWLEAAALAITMPGTITCGAYRKVKELKVDEEGHVTSYVAFPGGIDNRQLHVDALLSGKVAVPCGGQWLYGCSLIAPLEAFLAINGWCEDFCGGIGFEDCVTGLVLENAGYKFRYDTKLLTLESEEDHHIEKPFRKEDKGVSPKDKSHAVLDRTRGLKRFDNGFDLRAMRADVQAGKPFPIPTGPTVDWYDGQPLSEM